MGFAGETVGESQKHGDAQRGADSEGVAKY